MPSKVSARPEQSKSLPVNLAALHHEDALQHAYDAGRKFFLNERLMQCVAEDIWGHWRDENVPEAAGQTKDEFGKLLSEMMTRFQEGMSRGIEDARVADSVVESIDSTLDDMSSAVWDVYNVLTFMVKAMDDDTLDGLPVRCTLMKLRGDTERIASVLMDAVLDVRRRVMASSTDEAGEANHE